MAQKKFTFDINGKTREISGSYFEDSDNSTVLKNVTASNIYLPFNDGLVYISGSTLSASAQPVNNNVVSWNPAKGNWDYVTTNYTDVVVSASTPAPNSDVTGTFDNIRVKSLSNVNSGSALKVANGGTGLSSSAYPTGESLLIGNETNPLTLLTASNSGLRLPLLSTPTGWTLSSDVTLPVNTSDAEISIYTSSATWVKPAGTKMLRVLVQGGGGGGGSGGNRSKWHPVLGGGGGGAGGFVDSGMFIVDDSVTNIPVVVGAGGKGGIYPVTNSAGLAGNDGGISSFGSLYWVFGGNGGSGGNLNNSTPVSGGAATSAGTITTIYDNPVYNGNTLNRNIAGDAGGSGSSTAGQNLTAVTQSYYDVGGGGGGAALLRNLYNFAYAGGNASSTAINGGSTSSPNATSAISSSTVSLLNASSYGSSTQTNNIFVSSGGGGGATVTASSTDPILLVHFDEGTGVPKDTSFNKYNIVTGAAATYSSDTPFGIGYSSLSCSANEVPALLDGGFTTRTSDFTVDLWCKLATSGSSGAAPTGSNGSTFAPASTLIYLSNYSLGVSNISSSASTYRFTIWAGTSNWLITGSCPGVTLNQWQHVALRRSGSFLDAYVNGTGSVKVPVGVSDSNGTFNAIGSNTEAKYSIRGLIDEVRVLPYALTDEQMVSTTDLNNKVVYSDPSTLVVSGGLASNGVWGSGGGGGGASTNVTNSTYDSSIILLAHSDLSEVRPTDYSAYGGTINLGIGNNRIVSTASVGIPAINSIMPDGVFSSSFSPQLTNGYGGYYAQTTPTVTDNYTMESWFYLVNSGSSPNVTGSSFLMTAGYNDTDVSNSTVGGLGIAIDFTGSLRTWSSVNQNGVYGPPTSLKMIGNSWNHVVLQKTGSNAIIYLNGTSSGLISAASTTTTGIFQYGTGATRYNNYAFNGYAKEFIVTNRVKSQAEIQAYLAAVTGSQTTGSYPNPATNAISQGGNGGDGYVAVISYKY